MASITAAEAKEIHAAASTRYYRDFALKLAQDIADCLSRNEDIFLRGDMPVNALRLLSIKVTASVIAAFVDAMIQTKQLEPPGRKEIAKMVQKIIEDGS